MKLKIDIDFVGNSIFIGEFKIDAAVDEDDCGFHIFKNDAVLAKRMTLEKAIYCCVYNDFECKHESIARNIYNKPFYCYDCGVFLK